MSPRKLRIGVAGLGRAFSFMLPTFVLDERIELVAGADPRAEARDRFAVDFGAKTYAEVEALCADPDVEVRWRQSAMASMCWSKSPWLWGRTIASP